MNAPNPNDPRCLPDRDAVAASAPRSNPPARREGTGYGRSSGYAAKPRYSAPVTARPFRVA